MKRLIVLLVLTAVLGIAGIVFAQQQSSGTAPRPQQNTASDYTAGPWLCPMWGSGWNNARNNSGTRGPGWMMGYGYDTPRGAYGPMGPGMMYGPNTNSSAVPPQTKAAPPDQQQKPLPKR
jgi:hypothetical protein